MAVLMRVRGSYTGIPVQSRKPRKLITYHIPHAVFIDLRIGVELADELQPVRDPPGILGEVAAQAPGVRAAIAAQTAQHGVPLVCWPVGVEDVGAFGLLHCDRVDDLAGFHRVRRADPLEHPQDLGEIVAFGVGRPSLVEQCDDIATAGEGNRPGDEAVPFLEGP
jgi:hypothetical protein